jgi:putative flippase GtrA
VTRSGQLARFLVVGAGNVAVEFLAYAALVLTGSGYVLAKGLAFGLATANGYVWNRRWTFRAGGAHAGQVARYLTTQLAGAAVNVAGLALLVEAAGVHAIPAQLLAQPLVALVTFTLNRRWTFAPRPAARARSASAPA